MIIFRLAIIGDAKMLKSMFALPLLRLLSVLAFLWSPAVFAVSAGHIDDFEDGTTQDWQEGGASPNPPTNVANGGPDGVDDNYLENVSDGAGAGGKQIIFNTGANWTGDFGTSDINLVRLAVRVDEGSEGPLELRLAFQGTTARFISIEATSVPADGVWHTVFLPFGEVFMTQIAAGETFSAAAAAVSEVRLMHRPSITPGTDDWTAVNFNGTVGYDNIATLSVVPFSGWIWSNETFNTPSIPELEEGKCFGPLNFLIDSGDNWDIFGDDACVSRLTNNADPARTFWNYDPGTDTIQTIESFEARSTRPLVSAGGNLVELYGEDVEGGVGTGEERLATILAEPSNSDLLIAGVFSSFADANYAEAFGEVDVVVKDLPDVRAARVASDLEGRWYFSVFDRSVVRGNVDQNFSVAGLRVLDLEAGGACTFQVPDVIPDPEVTGNGDFFSTVQIALGGGVNLTDRGVFARNAVRDRSACTYEIDADGLLSVDFTLTNNTLEPPVVDAINLKYVASADDNYLVHAPDPDGAQEDPTSLVVGYRAPSGMTPNAIDGDYLFYLNIGEQEATGLGHTGGWTGPQLIDLYGRGRITFDSTTPGTVPPGQVGDWFSCDINLVLDAVEYQANGEPVSGTVSTAMEIFGEREVISCSYNLAPDGSLLLDLDVGDPVMFAGYVNDNGEVASLVNFESRIEFPESQIGNLVDFASVRHILAMKYTGDINGNEDGDALTNVEEFQAPLPPPPPLVDVDVAGDNNNNGAGDIGVLLRDEFAGRNFVYVMDGSTDAQLRKIAFGPETSKAYAAVPDVTGDGIPDHAVLVEGSFFARVKNGVSGALVSKPNFDARFEPVAMLAPGDVDGDAGQDLAVIGRKSDTGQVQVQVKRISNASLVSRYNYDKNYAPIDAVVVDNIAGSAANEIAVFGVDSAGRVRAQIKDASTGNLVSIVYFDKTYEPIAVAALPDPSGNRTYVAVLGKNGAGIIRAQIKNALTGALIKLVRFDSSYEPYAFLGFPDGNANGSGEVSVVGVDSFGKVRAQTKEIETAAFVSLINFDPAWSPVTAIGVDNVGGTGNSEIAVLGESDGQYRLQIKDLQSGAPVNIISVP